MNNNGFKLNENGGFISEQNISRLKRAVNNRDIKKLDAATEEKKILEQLLEIIDFYTNKMNIDSLQNIVDTLKDDKWKKEYDKLLKSLYIRIMKTKNNYEIGRAHV